MARALRAWAINRGGKNSVRNLRYGPRTRLVRGIYSHIYLARLGLRAVSRKKISDLWPYDKSFTHMTKLVRSRWLDFGLVLFLHVYELESVSVHRQAKKKISPISSHLDLTFGQTPHMLC